MTQEVVGDNAARCRSRGSKGYGKIFGQGQCCLGHQFPEWRLAAAVFGKVKTIGDASLCQVPLHIACAFQNKCVVMIGIVGVSATHPLVYQYRHFQFFGNGDCIIEGRIFVTSDRMGIQ